MHHPINPLVDCVFKALLADPSNKDLLISFLNAITKPERPIVDLELLNPYSPEEFIGDDCRIVDVRAIDIDDNQYQIEVQLAVRPWSAARVLYTWADLYQGQLQRGEHFRTLRPVISVWVFDQNLLPDKDRWHHVFRLWDRDAGVTLTDQLAIHTVELRKWHRSSAALAPDERWVYFLSEAGGWTDLPPSLRSPEMEKAMSVLERFSEKNEDYYRYQARMNYIREQNAIQSEREEIEQALASKMQALAEAEQALALKDQVLAQKDQVLAQKDQVLAEKNKMLADRDRALEALKARLRAAGLE